MAIGFLILVKSISLVFNFSWLFRCRFSLAHDDVGGSWARSLQGAASGYSCHFIVTVKAVTTTGEH